MSDKKSSIVKIGIDWEEIKKNMVVEKVDITKFKTKWTCDGCGNEYKLRERCDSCDKKERLKNIICPCCKSDKIDEGGVYSNNGVIGPGFHSHNNFPHLYCLACGVIFYKLKKQ